MGKIARYAECKTIKRLRIQSWFQVVSNASGLSASELEYQFSLENEQSLRSCIWDKYRRGEVAPRDALVETVERRYPGTKLWLFSDLWRQADVCPIGMAEIRSTYERLPKLIRSIFVAAHAIESSLFWRRPVEEDEVCEHLRRFGTVEALVATLTFVNEAEVTQNQYQHFCGVQLTRQYLERFSKHPALGGSVNGHLRTYLEARWANPGYFEVPEDSYSPP